MIYIYATNSSIISTAYTLYVIKITLKKQIHSGARNQCGRHGSGLLVLRHSFTWQGKWADIYEKTRGFS